MTQPPHDPAHGEQPEDQPWRPPSEAGRSPAGPPPSFDKEQQAPQGGQQPPPYAGTYGGPPPQDPYGGMPSYGGPGGGYVDPAAGLGSRWARLGAAIIDWILVGIVTNILAWPFPEFLKVEGPNDNVRYIFNGAGATVTFLLAVAAFFYYVVMHYKWGQTVGKKVLGIRVVREHDGGAVSFGQAAWRLGFNYLLGFFTCGIGSLVDNAWLLWDERKQALHDKVAKTVVVKAEPGTPDPYADR